MQTTRRAGLCHTTLWYTLPRLVRPRVYMRDWAAACCSMDRSRSHGRLHAAPGIWIRRLHVDNSSGLFRYALAEPFCVTECSTVSRACRLEGRQVNTYLFSAALQLDMYLSPPVIDSLLSQRPAPATHPAPVAVIDHGSNIRPQCR
jgi:hypothetical protein